MVDIRPFQAWFYNEKKVGALKNVIVPPYDVISEKEKQIFLKRNKYNFARIILGKKEHGYRAVAKLLALWKKEGVLIQDEKPHFYLWEQLFLHGKRRVKRRGLMATVSLSDFDRNKIKPHEKTFDAPKRDRLLLLKSSQSNLSPIFMMYSDPKKTLEKRILKGCGKTFLAMKDDQGVTSKVWRIEDTALERWLRDQFKRKSLYIIDGHHRFATAHGYGRTLRKSPDARKHVMVMMSNLDDPSVVIYPIYRVLQRVKGFHREKYLKGLEKYFDVKKRASMPSLKLNQWGVVFRRDPAAYVITLKKQNRSKVRRIMKGHPCVKELDISILQQLIIPKRWHTELSFVRGMEPHSTQESKATRRGKYEAMWFVNAPTIYELKKVADARQIMPAKSTFFYPKVSAGMLIRSF